MILLISNYTKWGYFENRGFVRSNWKTKNFNPADNPLLESSSTEEEEEYDEEYYDEVEEEVE